MIRTIALAAMIAITLVWINPALAAYPQTISTDAPWVNLPRPTDDPRWVEAFSHWDKRIDTDEVMKAIQLFKALAEDKPDEFAVHMWLCRSYYIAALRKQSKRDHYAKLSVAAGDRALAISPGEDNVFYWRAAAIAIHRELTKAEEAEIREFGKKYRQISHLPGMRDPLFSEAAQLWKKRENQAQLETLIELLKKIEASAPNRVEPKIWLSAVYYKMCVLENTDDLKAKWSKLGIEYGQAAMEMEPRNPAANLYTASCQVEYAGISSLLHVLRYSFDIGKELMVIVEEDPLYYFGAFSRFMAVLVGGAGSVALKITETLGFPQELILRLTSFSMAYEPDFLGNYNCTAPMLLALDRNEEAKQELLIVINADPDKLPGYEPENRLSKNESQKILDKYFPEK
jgi:hypothetical protein